MSKPPEIAESSRVRPSFWLWRVFAGLVLLTGFGLRYDGLAARPMHADEANQAVKLGALIERGEYRFDPHDHHGPTLYYFARIVAWVAGERTLAELSEVTVRLTPALFGTLAIALAGLLARPLGRGPALAVAALLAVSPAAVYYSRYFIQETLLVTFTLAAWVCGARWLRTADWKWAVATGACAGLMQATKASGILLAALSLGAVLAAGFGRRIADLARDRRASLGALAAAGVVVAAFYSSFGGNFGGLRDATATLAPMAGKVIGGATGHEKPWWYYGGLFVYQRNGGYVWDQTLFLALALTGGAFAGFQGNRLGRFALLYTSSLALLLSLAPYKTPWLVLNLVPGLCLLAGVALARWRALVSISILIAVVAQLGWQTRQAVFLRPADPRNPYAYQHTSPDQLKVAALAAAAPPGPVKVIGAEYWPLPWYLRGRTEVGYWTSPPEDCDAALVIVGAEQVAAVRPRLRGRYREEFLGLRPGYALMIFIREDSTDR